MKLLRIILVLSTAGWLLPLMAAQAQAQAETAPVPLSEILTGEAKTEYEAARILFGDNDYAGALVKFEQAFEHSSEPRLLWNMAVCEKNLRHYVQVLKLLDRYRREAHLTESQRGEAAQVVQTVQSLISEVRLTVDQDGAQVFVDDVPQGVTPLQDPLLVDLGSRKIRVSKDGFHDWEAVRDFSGHSIVVLTATMQAKPREAHLTIFADDDSDIHLDGTLVATGHFQGVLQAGEHTVYITAAGKQPFVRELVVKVGESRTLHVTLQAESSGVPPLVWVGASVLAAAGLGIGGYFLFRSPSEAQPTSGTLDPGVLRIPH
ncbi:MAG: PEGA domain-containing protein [Polyangiales bacterium]